MFCLSLVVFAIAENDEDPLQKEMDQLEDYVDVSLLDLSMVADRGNKSGVPDVMIAINTPAYESLEKRVIQTKNFLETEIKKSYEKKETAKSLEVLEDVIGRYLIIESRLYVNYFKYAHKQPVGHEAQFHPDVYENLLNLKLPIEAGDTLMIQQKPKFYNNIWHIESSPGVYDQIEIGLSPFKREMNESTALLDSMNYEHFVKDVLLNSLYQRVTNYWALNRMHQGDHQFHASLKSCGRHVISFRETQGTNKLDRDSHFVDYFDYLQKPDQYQDLMRLIPLVWKPIEDAKVLSPEDESKLVDRYFHYWQTYLDYDQLTRKPEFDAFLTEEEPKKHYPTAFKLFWDNQKSAAFHKASYPMDDWNPEAFTDRLTTIVFEAQKVFLVDELVDAAKKLKIMEFLPESKDHYKDPAETRAVAAKMVDETLAPAREAYKKTVQAQIQKVLNSPEAKAEIAAETEKRFDSAFEMAKVNMNRGMTAMSLQSEVNATFKKYLVFWEDRKVMMPVDLSVVSDRTFEMIKIPEDYDHTPHQYSAALKKVLDKEIDDKGWQEIQDAERDQLGYLPAVSLIPHPRAPINPTELHALYQQKLSIYATQGRNDKLKNLALEIRNNPMVTETMEAFFRDVSTESTTNAIKRRLVLEFGSNEPGTDPNAPTPGAGSSCGKMILDPKATKGSKSNSTKNTKACAPLKTAATAKPTASPDPFATPTPIPTPVPITEDNTDLYDLAVKHAILNYQSFLIKYRADLPKAAPAHKISDDYEWGPPPVKGTDALAQRPKLYPKMKEPTPEEQERMANAFNNFIHEEELKRNPELRKKEEEAKVKLFNERFALITPTPTPAFSLAPLPPKREPTLLEQLTTNYQFLRLPTFKAPYQPGKMAKTPEKKEPTVKEKIRARQLLLEAMAIVGLDAYLETNYGIVPDPNGYQPQRPETFRQREMLLETQSPSRTVRSLENPLDPAHPSIIATDPIVVVKRKLAQSLLDQKLLAQLMIDEAISENSILGLSMKQGLPEVDEDGNDKSDFALKAIWRESNRRSLLKITDNPDWAKNILKQAIALGIDRQPALIKEACEANPEFTGDVNAPPGKLEHKGFTRKFQNIFEQNDDNFNRVFRSAHSIRGNIVGFNPDWAEYDEFWDKETMGKASKANKYFFDPVTEFIGKVFIWVIVIAAIAAACMTGYGAIVGFSTIGGWSGVAAGIAETFAGAGTRLGLKALMTAGTKAGMAKLGMALNAIFFSQLLATHIVATYEIPQELQYELGIFHSQAGMEGTESPVKIEDLRKFADRLVEAKHARNISLAVNVGMIALPGVVGVVKSTFSLPVRAAMNRLKAAAGPEGAAAFERLFYPKGEFNPVGKTKTRIKESANAGDLVEVTAAALANEVPLEAMETALQGEIVAIDREGVRVFEDMKEVRRVYVENAGHAPINSGVPKPFKLRVADFINEHIFSKHLRVEIDEAAWNAAVGDADAALVDPNAMPRAPYLELAKRKYLIALANRREFAQKALNLLESIKKEAITTGWTEAEINHQFYTLMFSKDLNNVGRFFKSFSKGVNETMEQSWISKRIWRGFDDQMQGVAKIERIHKDFQTIYSELPKPKPAPGAEGGAGAEAGGADGGNCSNCNFEPEVEVDIDAKGKATVKDYKKIDAPKTDGKIVVDVTPEDFE